MWIWDAFITKYSLKLQISWAPATTPNYLITPNYSFAFVTNDNTWYVIDDTRNRQHAENILAKIA